MKSFTYLKISLSNLFLLTQKVCNFFVAIRANNFATPSEQIRADNVL